MQEDQRAKLSHKINPRKFERMQWDPGLRERKTTIDYLPAALRTAIYDGQFADGEELNQVELANFFHVSRVPIREACGSSRLKASFASSPITRPSLPA
jgi:hypothetical protein